MRRSAGLPWLFASAALALAAAEPARAAAQTACDEKRRSCIAECRAQHFNMDPKRNACIASCEADANRCLREQARAGGTIIEFPSGRCCQFGESDWPTAACDA